MTQSKIVISKNDAITETENAITNMIQNVNDTFPSIYSRADVIVLLQKLQNNINESICNIEPAEQETETYIFSESEKVHLIDSIVDGLSEVSWESGVGVDNDSADFELSGNRIYLEDVDAEFDYCEVEDEVRGYVRSAVNDFFNMREDLEAIRKRANEVVTE